MVETAQSVTTEQSQSAREKKFPVLEIFGPTLQGEGSVIGMQTMFVRLGGCDYRCTRCDSLHAVLPQLIKTHARGMSSRDIFMELESKSGHCKTVTLSGGNPCMWDLGWLVAEFNIRGWKVAVETQGTIWQDWIWGCDYVTVSPKGPGMGEKFEPEVFDAFVTKWTRAFPNHQHTEKVFSLKIVIFGQEDIEFAKTVHMEYPDIPMYLSLGNPYPPKPAKQDEGLEDIISIGDTLLHRMKVLYDDVKNEPILHDIRFLPQMHVLLWGNERGR